MTSRSISSYKTGGTRTRWSLSTRSQNQVAAGTVPSPGGMKVKVRSGGREKEEWQLGLGVEGGGSSSDVIKKRSLS